MRAICVYVDGGKGHYVPAKAVMEALAEMGHHASLEEFFDYLDIRWIGVLNKYWWRLMLAHSKVERKMSKFNDSKTNGMDIAIKYACRHCERALASNLKEAPVDFIFCTHPYASTILSAMLKDMGVDIPVYYFATDVFNAPVASVSTDIRKFLISTEEGAERVVKMGQPADSVIISPFPLQKNIADSPILTKLEARKKLGLELELFTVQLNLGGEGIGSIQLLEQLNKDNLPVQVVVVGGINKKMIRKFNFIKKHLNSNLKLVVAGFVSNVNEYLAASDIIAGRAGINTIVEAMYMHRPFLITELVYTVIPSAEYVEKYKVGWNATDDVSKQLNIVKDLIVNPDTLVRLDSNFNQIPIKYSSEKLAKMIVNDALQVTSPNH